MKRWVGGWVGLTLGGHGVDDSGAVGGHALGLEEVIEGLGVRLCGGRVEEEVVNMRCWEGLRRQRRLE